MSVNTTPSFNRKTLAVAVSLFCSTAFTPYVMAAPVDAVPAASASPSAAPAPQDTATPATDAKGKPKNLSTIMVTAQKREQAAIDVPASVTSIDASSLSRGGLDRLSDYADQIPGFSLTSIKPGENQLTIRGITTGSSQSAPTTAVYIDDAPVGSVNAYTAGSQLAPDIDPANLSRIEVLKGPQGTLYGSGAMGGMIRYVTTQPDFQNVKGSVTVGGDTVDGGANGGVGRFYVNLPLADDSMALQLSGFDQRYPGFIDDLNGRKDVNGAHLKGGRAAYTWIINSNWKVAASALYQSVHDDDSQTEDVDAKTLKPLYGELTQNALIPQPANTKLDLYNLAVHGQMGNFALVSSTTYQIINANAIGDVTPTYGALLGPVLGIPDLGTGISQYTSTKRFSEEVRIDSSAFDDKLQYEGGLYFTREIDSNMIPGITPFSTATLQPIPLPFSLVNANIDTTYKEYSAFANATYAFTPQFSIQGGVRYSSDHQEYSQNYNGLLVGPDPLVVTDGREHGDKVTYLATASYQPTDTQTLYARVANGYRAGGPNAVPPASVYPAPQTFAPDSLTSYEVGYKAVMDDGKLSLESALFTTHWKDIQIQTSAGGFNFFVNGGAATSKGAELTLLFYPVAGWSLRATGAYTDAKLTSAAPLAGGLDGDELPFVPKVTSSLSSNYAWVVGNGWGASLGGSVNFTGNRRSDYSLRAPVTVPSYTTVNLDAAITHGSWRYSLYVKNLGNSHGITYLATRSYLPGLNPTEVGITTPRTIGVEANFQF